MCGRLSIAVPQAQLEARFEASAAGAIETRYNAYPNHDRYPLPVITAPEPDRITLRWWGIVPRWWTRDKRGLTNIQFETLRDKKTFRKDLTERRCLVLADGFYEWQGDKGHKTPYYIHLASGEPFAFAGVFEDNVLAGHPLRTFAVITTAPNALMAKIHHRMPFILKRGDEKRWLHPETSPAEALAILEHPVSADVMAAYPVSTAVNRPVADGPHLREPV
jgi:putative SOS response-associated peptidase YedK